MADGQTTILGGANRPLFLEQPDDFYRLTRGYADIFAIRGDGLRRHLFRVEAGEYLFPTAAGGQHRLCAIGSLGSEFMLCQPTESMPPLEAVQHWVTAMTRILEPVQQGWTDRILLAGEIELPQGAAVSAPHRTMCFVRPVSGAVTWCGRPWPGDFELPVSPGALVSAVRDATLQVSTDCPAPQTLALGLAFIGGEVMAQLDREAAEHGAKLEDRLSMRRQAMDRSLGKSLSDLLSFQGATSSEMSSARLSVVVAVMQGSGLEVSPTLQRELEALGDQGSYEPLLRCAGLYYRPVMLSHDWWCHDGIAMVGTLRDGSPVGLVPDKGGGWLLATHDGMRRLNASLAREVSTAALQIYPSLDDRPIGLYETMRFGFSGTRHDVIATVIAAVVASAVVMVPPVAATMLFEHVVPAGDRLNLLFVLVSLIALAFGQSAFELMRGLCVARIETRLDTAIQAALFQRLLRLPVNFFRSFSAGDLTERVLGIQEARQMITGATISGLFGTMGVIASSVVLLALDWRLALAGVAILSLFLAASAALSFRQLAQERRQATIRGRNQGFVLQLLIGMTKLRAAHAEKLALAQWAWKSLEHRKAFAASRAIQSGHAALLALMPWISLSVVYLTLLWLTKSDQQKAALLALLPNGGATTAGGAGEAFTAAAFVGFATAFGQMTSGLKATVDAFTRLVSVAPLAERTAPVLQAVPDDGLAARGSPSQLTGNLVFRNVSFRYGPDSPLVLKGLNLEIKPGDFIAVAGPSGSGKSTLMRLILGFETLETGEIFYDGIPSHGIELSSLRSQIGIVLQNGGLSAGSIYENIVGSSGLGVGDAWAAARMVGLAEEIETMPMGMHTVLNDGAMTISGGQRQRILIARALVRKPRILLFDEATSALDNRTQAIVTRSLSSLEVTRIVIAHRLSTIREADRIIVLNRGSLVESGTYDELIGAGGTFSDLARRQLL